MSCRYFDRSNRLCKAGKARTLGMRVGEKFSNSSSKTTSVIGLRRGGKGVSVSSWSLQQESKAPLAPPGVRQTCSARSLKSLQGGTGTATGSPSTPFEPSAGIIAARKQVRTGTDSNVHLVFSQGRCFLKVKIKFSL